MTLRRIAASLFVATMLTLGGCGDGESDEACQKVCDKSEECGGAPTNCVESCKTDPPSDACLACYDEEACGDVGRCLFSCGD